MTFVMYFWYRIESSSISSFFVNSRLRKSVDFLNFQTIIVEKSTTTNTVQAQIIDFLVIFPINSGETLRLTSNRFHFLLHFKKIINYK